MRYAYLGWSFGCLKQVERQRQHIRLCKYSLRMQACVIVIQALA